MPDPTLAPSTARTGSLPFISIVVPCYQSGAWLAELVERIEKATLAHDGSRELILVEDASPDTATWPAVKAACERWDWVRGVSLARNSGQYRALLVGMERARGEFVVTLDDDLQTPPEELPTLLRAALGSAEIDATIACYEARQHSRVRRLGTVALDRLYTALSGKPAGIQSTSFRVLRRHLVQELCAQPTRSPMLGAMIFEHTQRVQNVLVAHHPRTQGRSGYSLWSLTRMLLGYAVSRTAAPLRALALLGALALAIGGAVGGALLAFPSSADLPAVRSGLAALAVALGGAILLGLGLVGEYVHAAQRKLTGPVRPSVREECGKR